MFILKQAIIERRTFKCHYTDDVLDRELAPYAIYEAAEGQVFLYALQLYNANHPSEPQELRNFEVKNLHSILLTEHRFRPDVAFSVTANIGKCRRVLASVENRWITV